MSARHRILLLPGLENALLEGGAMPRLRRLAVDAERADLLVSGLDLPETLLANLLWGAPPRRHGVTLWPSEEPSPLQGSLGADCARVASMEHSSSARLMLTMDDRLLQSALREGPRSEAVLQSARELDDAIAEWLHFEEAVHWILGGSVARACHTRLDPPNDCRSRGALAEWNRELAGDEVDALLRRPGIERVLQAESLLAWGLPRTIVIAEAGYSFEEGAAVIGHPEAATVAPTPILCFGGSFRRAWPRSVHDLRVAPTLADSLGLEGLEFVESGLK